MTDKPLHEAAAEILARDPRAHIVPLQGKVPVGKWGKRGWSPHGSWPAQADGIGIVPSSVGLVIIDQDAGDADAMRDYLTRKVGIPAVDYPSSREGRRHFVVRAAHALRNSKWSIQTASGDVAAQGEIRSAAGYAKVHSVDGFLDAMALPPEDAKTMAVLNALGAKRRPAGARNDAANAEAYIDPASAYQAFASVVADGLSEAEAFRATSNGQRAGWAMRMAQQKRDLRMVREVETGNKTSKLYSERGGAHDWAAAMAVEEGGSFPAYWMLGRETWIAYRDGRWSALEPGDYPKQMGRAWSDMVHALAAAGRIDGFDQERLATMARSRAVVAALAEIRDIDPARFDADPDLAGLPDGSALEVSTGRVLPPDVDRLISRSLGCAPDAACPTPRFDAYLREALPEEAVRHWVQAFARYSLTGNVERELAIILRGPPGTGKSTLLEVMRAVVGDYRGTMLPDNIETQGSSPHPEWLLEFDVNRAVFVTDLTPKRPWNTGVLQQVISGETVRGRALYAHASPFKPTAKLWMASNEAPKAHGGAGIWRRLAVVGFDVVPARKAPDLKAAIIERELPGVLAWIMAGDMALLDRIPISMKVAAKSDKGENQPLTDALEQVSVAAKGQCIALKVLLEALEERRLVRPNMTVPTFSKELRAEGVVEVDRGYVDMPNGESTRTSVVLGRKLTTF